MGRVLGLGGVAQDRPRQAVGLVEVLVGQPDEGGRAGARLAGLCRRAVCQLDDLGRSVHDDMTPERRETFTNARHIVRAEQGRRSIETRIRSTIVDRDLDVPGSRA